jgi:hypothetical protein
MAKHNELCPGHASDVAANRLPMKGIMRVHDPITAQTVVDAYNTKVAADTGSTPNDQCAEHTYICASHMYICNNYCCVVQHGVANARPTMVMQESIACKPLMSHPLLENPTVGAYKEQNAKAFFSTMLLPSLLPFIYLP